MGDVDVTRARIRSGLVAYAAGDAAGVPWEGCTADEIDYAGIDEVPRRGGWPRGATSDDTALTLLVVDYLADRGAVVDEHDFLSRLAAAVPGIRGVGPSTHAAVARFRDTGAVHAESGDTNGAAMRALPIGWAVADDDLRRTVTAGLSRTTHGAAPAIAAACVAATMASAAVDGGSAAVLLDAAAVETGWAEAEFGAGAVGPARRALDGAWRPRRSGVQLDAAETLAGVITVIRHAADSRAGVADALRYAVSLGGDTDTVAAIAGGILGGRESRTPDIPWLARVRMPDAAALDAAADALAALRG
ncbi:hypothetical protein E4P42_21255 [Mycobacterium sp. PS03-16]|uniref:ADP-ribosylglycohydrolase family protein n=1 Tax=Mycobacterium sp. PS03-16 TaxID=2559611 RepID=UPI0010746711|nr:ADP-ribosylglycohydrolase family protein [Mycobacterium sp. PS03-16]TFV55870.1 hypothetical protein E4P42_21255 [Mycobacterium sp. PS03-16]